MNLCLFVIQCTCVHDLDVVCICAMFHGLCSRECVGRVKGTIVKMLCIFIIKAPLSWRFEKIIFAFVEQGSNLFFLHASLCCCCVVLPRPIKIMNQIEISILICC